jgi:DNA-binding MarR family transcriptional regulator
MIVPTMLTPGEAPPAALGGYAGFLMNWIGSRSRARFVEAMAEFGLHPRDFGLMSVIAATPGVTQQGLGESMRIDPSTIVAAVDSLQERGLAERRIDPADRRRRLLHLTERGGRVLREAQARAEEMTDELFAALSDEERGTLLALLQKLAGLVPAEPSSR